MNQKAKARIKEPKEKLKLHSNSARILPTKALMNNRAPKITAFKKQLRLSRKVSK